MENVVLLKEKDTSPSDQLRKTQQSGVENNTLLKKHANMCKCLFERAGEKRRTYFLGVDDKLQEKLSGEAQRF